MNSKIRISFSEKVFHVINFLLLTFVLVLSIYPVLYVIFASFSRSDLLIAHSGILLKPLGFSADAYIKVFQNESIIRSYGITLLLVVVGTFVNLLLSVFAAYFVSKKKLYARNFVMFFMLFTMYFSGGLVPLYLAVKSYGLYDSFWALVLPTAISVFNVIVLRTAFTALPDSLEESAEIDGAGAFTILFRILVPLIKPTLTVICLYYLVGHWNAWFNAMIFLQDSDKFPLQLVLRNILIENSDKEMTIGVTNDNAFAVSESLKYAVIVVSILPIMILYPILQKYFEKGVMIGAVKG